MGTEHSCKSRLPSGWIDGDVEIHDFFPGWKLPENYCIYFLAQARSLQFAMVEIICSCRFFHHPSEMGSCSVLHPYHSLFGNILIQLTTKSVMYNATVSNCTKLQVTNRWTLSLRSFGGGSQRTPLTHGRAEAKPKELGFQSGVSISFSSAPPKILRFCWYQLCCFPSRIVLYFGIKINFVEQKTLSFSIGFLGKPPFSVIL